MIKDAFLACAGLAVVAMSLLSCVSRPEPQAQAPLGRTAWYEQQVEEGFGRLDQLPTH
ncbi:MAG TPA: hypothetical protein VN802_14300 [Stellaceae bacterium]|nr:hypothetical protein [Stellaceae bacterium]